MNAVLVFTGSAAFTAVVIGVFAVVLAWDERRHPRARRSRFRHGWARLTQVRWRRPVSSPRAARTWHQDATLARIAALDLRPAVIPPTETPDNGLDYGPDETGWRLTVTDILGGTP